MDHQVKLRGFRIELGEIEAVLSAHPQVQETVLLVQQDTPSDERLVAYVVPLAATAADAFDPPAFSAELRTYLKQRLPGYMLPAAFVTLDALPLTPNGKVDRRALPAPERNHTGQQTTFEAPRTPTEERLAGIWAEILGLEQVGVQDDFFDLGGHSLLATQVVSRVRVAFQVELPLQDFFETPTVAGLAQLIEQTLLIKPSDANMALTLEGLEEERL
jgi:acyl carrier protein